MKVKNLILKILSIFVMRNDTLYGINLQIFHELRDRQTIESIENNYTFGVLFRGDLSRFEKKSFIMRNNTQGRNATGSIISQIQLPEIAKDAAIVSTTAGFFTKFFDYLPNYSSAIEAFNAVNVEYYLLHNHFKYSSFKQFKSLTYKTS